MVLLGRERKEDCWEIAKKKKDARKEESTR